MKILVEKALYYNSNLQESRVYGLIYVIYLWFGNACVLFPAS